MPGPLSAERPIPENTLTGGPDTSISHELAQDFKQVMRTKHMDREARTGNFGVNTAAPLSRHVNQKATKPANLRVKDKFKKRRFRK